MCFSMVLYGVVCPEKREKLKICGKACQRRSAKAKSAWQTGKRGAGAAPFRRGAGPLGFSGSSARRRKGRAFAAEGCGSSEEKAALLRGMSRTKGPPWCLPQWGILCPTAAGVRCRHSPAVQRSPFADRGLHVGVDIIVDIPQVCKKGKILVHENASFDVIPDIVCQMPQKFPDVREKSKESAKSLWEKAALL